jgi:phage head maturation protease
MTVALLNCVTKNFDSILENGKLGPGEVIAIINTDRVDRDREVVLPSAFQLGDYRRNPIVQYGHARGLPMEGEHGMPVGTNLWIKPTSDGHGLIAKTKFDIDDPFAARVYGKVRREVLRSWSVTFIPHESGPPTAEEIRRRPDWANAKTVYRRVTLVEYSVVGAPANVDAITVAKDLDAALSVQEEKAMDDERDEVSEAEKSKAMCAEATRCFANMKHVKGAALHMHVGKMELHHTHGITGMGDDADEARSISKAYAEVPHRTVIHLAADGPVDDGYRALAVCPGGDRCEHVAKFNPNHDPHSGKFGSGGGHGGGGGGGDKKPAGGGGKKEPPKAIAARHEEEQGALKDRHAGEMKKLIGTQAAAHAADAAKVIGGHAMGRAMISNLFGQKVTGASVLRDLKASATSPLTLAHAAINQVSLVHGHGQERAALRNQHQREHGSLNNQHANEIRIARAGTGKALAAPPEDSPENKTMKEPEHDDSAHDAELRSLCMGGIKAFCGQQHNKAAALHVEPEKFHLHHAHGDDEMTADDEGAIKKAYDGVAHCKGAHVGHDAPSDEGYTPLFGCEGGDHCKCAEVAKASDEDWAKAGESLSKAMAEEDDDEDEEVAKAKEPVGAVEDDDEESAAVKEEELRSKADDEDEDEEEDEDDDEDEDEEDAEEEEDEGVEGEDDEEEDEEAERDEKSAKDPYDVTCKALADVASKIKHSGKAGHMFVSVEHSKGGLLGGSPAAQAIMDRFARSPEGQFAAQAQGGGKKPKKPKPGKKAMDADNVEVKAHWMGHDDDYDDDAEEKGYHSRAEIKAMCMKCKGCKSVTCSTSAPAGEEWDHIHPPDKKDPRSKAAAMSETTGALGGYLAGLGAPAAEDEGDDTEIEGIRRYHYVKMFGGAHHKACGRVHSMHSRGLVPGVENDVVATKDNPHARVQLYKAYGDGHVPTSIHVAHPVSRMERIPDLKPPSKRPQRPVLADAVRKVEDEPAPAPREKRPAKANPDPEPTPVVQLQSPLSAEEIQNAYTWNLIRTGKVEAMIGNAVTDGFNQVLGKG